MHLSPRRTGVLVMALALTGGLAACGSGSSGGAAASTSSTTGAAGGGDAALAAMVPDAIKADGTITIGTDSTYAPSEFLDTDGKTVIGFDVDLFNAVAAKLGLKTQWVPAPFDNIIPSVLSGKYEIGVSSFTINPDREKQVDMISYFSAGTQWASAVGQPAERAARRTPAARRSPCRRRPCRPTTSPPARRRAPTAGKPAITIDQYQGQDQATAAVVSGKDDAMLADSPVIAYAVKQTKGKLALLGDIYDSAPYGYVGQEGPGPVRPGPRRRAAGPDRRRQLRDDPGQVGRLAGGHHHPGRQPERRMTP